MGTSIHRGISSVVERLLSMHEAMGSIPIFSILFALYREGPYHVGISFFFVNYIPFIMHLKILHFCILL